MKASVSETAPAASVLAAVCGGGMWYNSVMRGVVPTELNRLTTRSRQRGFTLIEIAIAMVVIGLLLGASAWLSRALDERRQLQREMQRLEIVRDAIVGYAIRNRTRERILKVVPWFGPKGSWEFRLPAGRPYLPCPDFDGDGYEDRVPLWAFPQGMEANPDLAVTVTIGELAPPWNGHLTWTQYEGSVHPYGECRVSRGGVPWRTLGVDPSDGWGNRHTYFADPVFSNSIFGFDRQTVADIYDPRVPSAPGYGPSLRHFKHVLSERSNPSMLTAPPSPPESEIGFHNRSCPAAICIGNSACEPAQHGAFETLEDIRRCAWRLSADPENPTIFKGGLVTTEDIPGRKYYPAGSVVDGLPFVLASHGPNGRYAVNHWATLRNRNRGDLGFAIPICNPAWQTVHDDIFRVPNIPAEDRIQHLETANAARMSFGGVNASHDFCSPIDADFAGKSVLYNPASFVWQPPGVGDASDFDDLIAWHTRGELTAEIRGNIPRLPKMQFAYFPPDFP